MGSARTVGGKLVGNHRSASGLRRFRRPPVKVLLNLSRTNRWRDHLVEHFSASIDLLLIELTMAKSRIGPFALEAPLAPQKKTGQVFRGIHLEQRKLAALRVFQVPMGMTPESRQAFASQLEQLKQLRHRGIIRCYGGGFDTRKAYLAYELVDGESLDQILERRQRLPWEATFDYSQQLAEALQYAHQMGWSHGRLKPDKVLIASDGTVKIGDWRREAISSMLGGRLDIHGMQFSAPEIFDGQPADEKSDLYSVGALMYTMLTGFPPFQADADHLPELIRSTPAPNVSASVMDCPVWLNAIVGQLLHKDPSQRPYSATALQLAFKEAQRRQAEGVGVLQHAAAGFSPLQMNVNRNEAEKVLGIKPKKKRKKRDDTPFFEQAWVLLLGLVLAVGAIVWSFLPLSEETLRARSEQLLPPESSEWMDWNEARDDYLLQLQRRFPDGKHADWAEDQISWVNAREYERKLNREHRKNRRGEWTDADRQYWQAWEYEEFGDLLTALDKYRALVGLYSNVAGAEQTVYLANEGIQRVRERGLADSQLKDFVAKKLSEAEEAYDAARVLEAREKWEWIVNLYSGNSEVESLVAEAQQRIDELKSRN